MQFYHQVNGLKQKNDKTKPFCRTIPGVFNQLYHNNFRVPQRLPSGFIYEGNAIDIPGLCQYHYKWRISDTIKIKKRPFIYELQNFWREGAWY